MRDLDDTHMTLTAEIDAAPVRRMPWGVWG